MSQKPPVLFRPTGFDDVITRIALPVYGEQDEQEYCLGTCVMLTDRIGLASMHVFDEYIERFGFEGPENWRSLAKAVDVGEAFCLGVCEVDGEAQYGSAAAAVRVPTNIVLSNDTDICVFVFEGRQPRRLPSLSISLFGAPAGSDVALFGYTNLAIDSLAIRCEPRTSTGCITEALPNVGKRLPFPVLRTNARLEGAMSGGAAFHGGSLCGVACDSFDFDSKPGEVEEVSHLAMLAPIMAARIPESPGKERFLLEVLQSEGLRIVDGHRAKVHGDGVLFDVQGIWTDRD